MRSPSFRIEYKTSNTSRQLKMYLTVLIDQLVGTNLTSDYCVGAYNHSSGSIQCVSNTTNLMDT